MVLCRHFRFHENFGVKTHKYSIYMVLCRHWPEPVTEPGMEPRTEPAPAPTISLAPYTAPSLAPYPAPALTQFLDLNIYSFVIHCLHSAHYAQ
jgi:hypothetical protein